MRRFGPVWKRILLVLGILALLVFPPWVYILLETSPRIYRLEEDVPGAPVAIVFGAGLTRAGLPSPYLADRVGTAVELYKRGAVRKLLMSGDNRMPEYNEPEAMKRLAVELGVPEEDIVMDYAGRRSYDTCYRARYVFGVRKAVTVTQEYHLPRTVFTCNRLGIDTAGVIANRRRYALFPLVWYQLREIISCDTAWLDLYLFRTQPVLGPFEPIDAD